jgi:hypothetical protein
MKNKITNYLDHFLIFVFIFLLSLINSSCKTRSPKCVARPPDMIQPVVVKLLEDSIKAEFIIYKIDLNGKNIEFLSRDKKDEKLFNTVKSYFLTKNLPINNKTMAIVLYYDNAVSKTLTIIDGQISAISIYYIEKRKIKHQLFIKNSDGIFIGIENTKVTVPFISHNHSQFYIQEYVYQDIQDKSYITFMGDLAEDVYNNLKDYKKVPFRFEKEHTLKKYSK